MPPVATYLRASVQSLASADQGTAGRGGGLLGRLAHHARRGRVHHQRRRARGGEPVAPESRGGLRRGNGIQRASPAQLPHHPGTGKLDRTERYPQGKPHRPHRPERQVLGDDASQGDGPRVQRGRRLATGVLSDVGGEHRRRAQRVEDRGQVGRGRRGLPGRQSQGGRGDRRVRPQDHQERRRTDLHLGDRAGRGHAGPEEPAAAKRLGRRLDRQP